MNLPFTVEQFLHIFKKYNIGIFPIQLVFYLAAALVIYFLIRGIKPKITLYILGFMWLWMGIVYHILYFSEINPAAYIFGAFFIIQGAVFLYYAVSKKEIFFEKELDGYSFMGWLIIFYGLIIYPALGYLNGHIYPAAPIFSAPCPTTIFTFGILLFAKRLPKLVIILPFLWALIAFAAAWQLTISEDYGLVISAVIASGMLLYKDRAVKKELKHA